MRRESRNVIHRLGTRGWRRAALLAALLAVALLAPGLAMAQDAPWLVVVSPQNSLQFSMTKAGKEAATLGLGGWGPNWGWVGYSSNQKGQGAEFTVDAPFVVKKDTGDIIDLKMSVKKSGEKTVTFTFNLNAAKDVPLTLLMAGFGAAKDAMPGTFDMTDATGAVTSQKLPTDVAGGPAAVASAIMKTKDQGDISVKIEPAVPVAFDGAARLTLAKDVYKAGAKTVTMTFTFPEAVQLVATEADVAKFMKPLAGPDWFEFKPANDVGPSVIGMENWLDKPAGKSGPIKMVGDKFQLGDGTPVKFWGTNLSYGASAPGKPEAEFTAARFAKYGVNAVRMHKFTGAGWEGIGDPNDCTKMLPEGMERLDYFSKQLGDRGIYYGWSHTFGLVVKPGNRDRLLAADEILNRDKGRVYALINWAEDCQDLMIQMVVDMLKHQNPHTGKTYAQDPALAYIELQNEDDIFFYTTDPAYKNYPTYAKSLRERFSDFLKAKYSSQAGLKEAWGKALKGDESLEARNIAIQSNPWFMGEDNMPKIQGGEKQRMLDNARFFYEVQSKFYTRFVKAIRDTGYQGAICGSPWQAPGGLPHYYNLLADYNAGYIDRHNYYNGGLFGAMVSKPGSGYFSSGLQQVVDRPFGQSEWINEQPPSYYSADGVAILAVYGMGLQGWDASYEFQSSSNTDGFHKNAGSPPYNIWNGDAINQIGQYPALARMIMRGDVKEGAVISARRVSEKGLAEGNLDFTDKIQQTGDVKNFGGTVPQEALAAGRVVVEFPKESAPSTFPDLTKELAAKVIKSNTGELVWDFNGKGFFTVDTAGTKAVVGFPEGKEQTLGKVKIKIDSNYASVFLTSLEPKATLDTAKTALVSAMARITNADMKYFEVNGSIPDYGKGPVVVEPVKGTIAIQGRNITAVNVLDIDGRRTQKTVPVAGGAFTIDGARDQTVYYEVVFE
jgi:hypothetical protein